MVIMANLLRVFCCISFFVRTLGQLEHRVPDPPENVRVKLEATSATLWWEPPSTAAEVLVRGYTISYGIETPTKRVIIEGVDTNAFTIEGLKPNATYVFAITAYNEADGEDSERVLLTGTSMAPDPRNGGFRFPAPSDITVSRTSATDVDISWTDPLPESRGENALEFGTKRRFYLVRYYASTHPEKVFKISTLKTKAFITNLSPESTYHILVRTILPNGQESAWSREELIRTSSKQHNPNDLTFFNSSSTRVHIAESCDFEASYLCGFFSEATAPLQYHREASVSTGGIISTHSGNSGHFMVVKSSHDLKSTFGRFFSPVWNFDVAGHICFTLWAYLQADSYGILTANIQYEGDSINMAVPVFKKRMESMKKQKWIEIAVESKIIRHKSFQLIIEVRKASPRSQFWMAVDDIHVRGGHCAHSKGLLKGNVADEETDVDLLTPLENLINTDPRVYRTKGLDGLPAVGIQRGVEIVVPYRIYLPKKFYRNFAIVASIKPKDDQGGYLFAVVNAFDTVVDLGLHLSPAGRVQTNVSLVYTDSQTESSSTVVASFLVPAFTNQWTQLAIEVNEDNVVLYFRCMRFATRQVRRIPMQLQMDDASKLYIANAGPIIKNGFEPPDMASVPPRRPLPPVWILRLILLSLQLTHTLGVPDRRIFEEDDLIPSSGKPSPNILPAEKVSQALPVPFLEMINVTGPFLTKNRKKRQVIKNTRQYDDYEPNPTRTGWSSDETGGIAHIKFNYAGEEENEVVYGYVTKKRGSTELPELVTNRPTPLSITNPTVETYTMTSLKSGPENDKSIPLEQIEAMTESQDAYDFEGSGEEGEEEFADFNYLDLSKLLPTTSEPESFDVLGSYPVQDNLPNPEKPVRVSNEATVESTNDLTSLPTIVETIEVTLPTLETILTASSTINAPLSELTQDVRVDGFENYIFDVEDDNVTTTEAILNKTAESSSSLTKQTSETLAPSTDFLFSSPVLSSSKTTDAPILTTETPVTEKLNTTVLSLSSNEPSESTSDATNVVIPMQSIYSVATTSVFEESSTLSSTKSGKVSFSDALEDAANITTATKPETFESVASGSNLVESSTTESSFPSITELPTTETTLYESGLLSTITDAVKLPDAHVATTFDVEEEKTTLNPEQVSTNATTAALASVTTPIFDISISAEFSATEALKTAVKSVSSTTLKPTTKTVVTATTLELIGSPMDTSDKPTIFVTMAPSEEPASVKDKVISVKPGFNEADDQPFDSAKSIDKTSAPSTTVESMEGLTSSPTTHSFYDINVTSEVTTELPSTIPDASLLTVKLELDEITVVPTVASVKPSTTNGSNNYTLTTVVPSDSTTKVVPLTVESSLETTFALPTTFLSDNNAMIITSASTGESKITTTSQKIDTSEDAVFNERTTLTSVINNEFSDSTTDSVDSRATTATATVTSNTKLTFTTNSSRDPSSSVTSGTNEVATDKATEAVSAGIAITSVPVSTTSASSKPSTVKTPVITLLSTISTVSTTVNDTTAPQTTDASVKSTTVVFKNAETTTTEASSFIESSLPTFYSGSETSASNSIESSVNPSTTSTPVTIPNNAEAITTLSANLITTNLTLPTSGRNSISLSDFDLGEGFSVFALNASSAVFIDGTDLRSFSTTFIPTVGPSETLTESIGTTDVAPIDNEAEATMTNTSLIKKLMTIDAIGSLNILPSASTVNATKQSTTTEDVIVNTTVATTVENVFSSTTSVSKVIDVDDSSVIINISTKAPTQSTTVSATVSDVKSSETSESGSFATDTTVKNLGVFKLSTIKNAGLTASLTTSGLSSISTEALFGNTKAPTPVTSKSTTTPSQILTSTMTTATLKTTTKGAIQELKLHDDPGEAANQCNEDWWKSKRRQAESRKGEASGFPDDEEVKLFSTEKPDIENNQINHDDKQANKLNIGFPPQATPESNKHVGSAEASSQLQYVRDGFTSATYGTDLSDSLILPFSDFNFARKQILPHKSIPEYMYDNNEASKSNEDDGNAGYYIPDDKNLFSHKSHPYPLEQYDVIEAETSSSKIPTSAKYSVDMVYPLQPKVKEHPMSLNRIHSNVVSHPGQHNNNWSISLKQDSYLGRDIAGFGSDSSNRGDKGDKGEKGEKGDPGPPGVCSSNCNSFYSTGKLSDDDIARIASYPSVKETKINQSGATNNNFNPTTLPPYDPHRHRFTTKGEKGDRGPIGPPGPPGVHIRSEECSTGGMVTVFSTSTELFASSQLTPLGQLAFSVASQQLFIRVNNGWSQVRLEGFYPTVEQRPPVPITAEVLSSKDDHLAYWLNDNAASVSMHGNGPCVRRSVESVVSSPPIGQVDAPETPKRVEQSTTPLTQYQHYQRQEQEQPRPEVVVLSPGMRSPSTLAPMSTLPAAAAQVNLRPSSARAHANPRDKIIHLIALNIPMSGNMKGLRGVDRECYHASRIAGFKTTFRAFVSNRVQDLFQVVHHADRDTPVVNARGEQLFERWEDAFSTTITPQDRPIYSFDHRNIYDDPTWQDRYIWHGSDDNGRRVDNAYCEGWRSENSYAHGMASQLIRGRPLVNEGEQVTCHRKLIVLCIENMSKYNIDLLLSRHRVIRRKK